MFAYCMNPSVAPLLQRGNDILRRPCRVHCHLPLLLLQPRPLRLPLSPALGVAALSCLQSHEYICCWKCDNTADSAENHARKVASGTVPVLVPCEGGFLDAPHAISTHVEEGEGSLLGAGEVRTGDRVPAMGQSLWRSKGTGSWRHQPCNHVCWGLPGRRGLWKGELWCLGLVYESCSADSVGLSPVHGIPGLGTTYCSACTHVPLPMAAGSECPLTPLPL